MPFRAFPLRSEYLESLKIATGPQKLRQTPKLLIQRRSRQHAILPFHVRLMVLPRSTSALCSFDVSRVL